ncbi:glucose 1-dehydrogenase [Bartonella sp. LJL80]
MNKRLAGKTALITGAGAGFGAAMAKRFAAEGAQIAVVDINPVHARNIVEEIGDNAIAITADISHLGDVHHMVEATVAAFGRIDVFVANAGFTHRRMPLEHVSEDVFDLVQAVNVKALYYGVQSVLPVMERQKSGVILTMGAIAVERPRSGMTWFTAAKGWIMAASRAMALELADRNIRVNCLCPAEADTQSLQSSYGDTSKQTVEQLRAEIPLGRLSTPEDVANAALWLASDEAAFVTGAVLPIDGGYRL